MSEWGNVGPAFDGVRASYGNENYRLDWFGANAVRAVVDRWDQPRWDRQIYGFFGLFTGFAPKTTLEPFALWKHNRVALCERVRPGHTDTGIPGNRPPTAAFGLDSELRGSVGARLIRPGIRVGGTLGGRCPPLGSGEGVRLFGEYQRASGDARNGDGAPGSFDQLYPAWKFGTADPIGWSNMQEGVAGAEWKVFRTWTFRTAYHEIWLLSLNDNLYSATGSVLGRNPQAGSKRIGCEYDVRATHTFGAHLSLMAGVGRFSAGEYWRDTRKTDGTTYPFVMWMYSF